MTDTVQPNVDKQIPPDLTSLINKTEEDLYAMALAEIQTDTRRPGIWAKALSESIGDNQKAQAIYIRLRVVQLSQDRESQQIKNGKRPFMCPLCGKPRSVTKEQLLSCIRDDYWTFRCPDCQRLFDIRKALPTLTLPVTPSNSAAIPCSTSMSNSNDVAWSSGAMIGLVLGTILIPLIGIILGLSNNSAPLEKKKQAKTLLIIGCVVFAIHFFLFFVSQVISQAVQSQF